VDELDLSAGWGGMSPCIVRRVNKLNPRAVVQIITQLMEDFWDLHVREG
jgi:hypothetical protein